MKENIYIDFDEDIQSVIAKIETAKADELDLIVPTGARVLQNIVDAHLLKEAGEGSSKKLRVLTSDLMGRVFAERAGLTVLSQTSYGAENEGMVITQAVSTGRISDIVPRRKAGSAVPLVTAKKLSGGKSSAKPAEKLFSKTTVSKSPAKKNTGPAASAGSKKKGEIGANFLKSYREERARANVFSELSKINKGSRFGWGRFFKFKAFTLVSLALAAVVLASAAVFARTLPKADILIYPMRETKSVSVDVLVSSKDAKIDLEKGIVPGELLISDKSESGSFTATGEKNVSQKAKGEITIYNVYSSQSQTFVPSRFQSPDGKIFWTVKSVTVPGMSTKDGQIVPGKAAVGVSANEPGEVYNIGPARFTMPALKGTPRADKIYAISDSPMAGGKTGQSKVVSSDDLAKAFASLKEKARLEFETLKQDMPDGFQLWPEAYNEELADSAASPDLGESAETFQATIKMVARSVVFKTQDLDAYINQQVAKDLGENKIVLADSKEISFLKAPVVDYQKGTVLAALKVKYDIADKIDSAALINEILKKKEKDIKSIFSVHENIERVQVSFSPFWVRSVPANPDRVSLKVYGL